MKTKSPKLAHKTSKPTGALTRFFARCGRTNCKCAQSKEHWHGPYFYVRSPNKENRRKHYVRGADVKRAALAQQQERHQDAELRSASISTIASWRSLRDSIRQIERGIQGDSGGFKVRHYETQNY